MILLPMEILQLSGNFVFTISISSGLNPECQIQESGVEGVRSVGTGKPGDSSRLH